MATNLNLVLSYPVHWGTDRILRDYVQNFWDSIGPDNFGKEFHYGYNKETRELSMWASGRGFPKDFLMYMGVSTKRGTGRYIGHFGEGFKIASLCAYRDLHWQVRMESEDWRIRVTETPGVIDGTEVRFLAYETQDGLEFYHGARLTLTGATEKDAGRLPDILSDFYYKGSPAFGEPIAKGDGAEVYRTPDGKNTGVLYANYLNRAYLNAPVTVCLHSFLHQDSREREPFGKADVSRCLAETVRRLTPAGAAAVLRAVPGQWGRCKTGRFAFDWRETVGQLISKAAEDPAEAARFRADFCDTLVADFPENHGGYRRTAALEWKRGAEMFQQRSLVSHGFATLGIDSLEDLCEKHGGYEALREPSPEEKQYIAILERVAADVFAGFTCYGAYPPVKVIKNRPPVAGTAHLSISGGQRKKNAFGVPVWGAVRSVQLRPELFTSGNFAQCLATYMHELLHQFGGDSSAAFRGMVSRMALRMAGQTDRLAEYETEWNRIGGEWEDA